MRCQSRTFKNWISNIYLNETRKTNCNLAINVDFNFKQAWDHLRHMISIKVPLVSGLQIIRDIENFVLRPYYTFESVDFKANFLFSFPAAKDSFDILVRDDIDKLQSDRVNHRSRGQRLWVYDTTCVQELGTQGHSQSRITTLRGKINTLELVWRNLFPQFLSTYGRLHLVARSVPLQTCFMFCSLCSVSLSTYLSCLCSFDVASLHATW